MQDVLLWVKGTSANQSHGTKEEDSKGIQSVLDEWCPRELLDLIRDCTRFTLKECLEDNNHFDRPACQQVVERLQNMRNSVWWHALVQELKQVE